MESSTRTSPLHTRLLHQPDLLFPVEYLGFVMVSSLDLIFTIAILSLGGRELNPIARTVLEVHGTNGMLLFKFALVILVVVLCEWIGRRQRQTGQKLAWVCVGITAVPVLWSVMLLTNYTLSM